MKVLFLTEGGEEYGFGHMTRCIALTHAIEQEFPKAETFLIVDCDVKGRNFLTDLSVNAVTMQWTKINNNLRTLIHGCDAVIVDSYLATEDVYKEITKHCGGSLVIIDDFNRLRYPKGTLISPSVYGDQLDYEFKQGSDYLLGKNYVILRQEFWKVPEKVIRSGVEKVVISLGGSERASKMLGKLSDWLRSDVVNGQVALTIIDPRKKTLNAKEMIKAMLSADICITGGGQTTEELARLGVPSIGLCFSENQFLNLEYLSKAGFIESMGWYDEANLREKLFEAVEILKPARERRHRSHLGRALIDGQGARRIAKQLLGVNTHV